MRLHRSGRLGLAALAAACMAGSAPDGFAIPMIGQGELSVSGEVTRTLAETPVVLFHYFNLAPDCGPSAVTIRLVEPPAHGDVAFIDGEERPYVHGHSIFADGDPRTACSGQLVTTRDATYTPAAGFVGADRMVLEFREGDRAFSDVIAVEVIRVR
jgi:hypothetical protein